VGAVCSDRHGPPSPAPSSPVPSNPGRLAGPDGSPGRTCLAQSQRFLLGPGSNIGQETKIEPKNCVTAADGSITCDTKIVNPKGDTPAKPIYAPFNQ